jgi:hypothetical protein
MDVPYRKTPDNIAAKQDADRSELTALYPHAKTKDELLFDDERRSRIIADRRPKRARLKISLYGALLFFICSCFAQLLVPLWSMASIAVIFLTFFVAIILTVTAYGWIAFANTVFYFYGRSHAFFWVAASLVAFVGMLLVLLVVPFGGVTGKAGIGSVFYFTALLCVLSVLFSKKKPSSL